MDFIWSASDPEGDDINYTINIRNDIDDETLVFSSVNDTTLTVTGLRFGLKYFWQVAAKDTINGEEILSEISSFSTLNVNQNPESNRFLFVREINGNNVIFARDDEGNEFQLTSEERNSFRPRRNTVSNKIAFLRNTNQGTHIFTMDLDGNNKRQITNDVVVNGFDLNELDFTWTVNGGRILYPNFDRLFTVNNNGTGLEEVYKTTDGSFISEIAINGSEDVIALKTNEADGYNATIFTIDQNGDLLNNILSGMPGAAGGLDISVDGQQVLYWRDVSDFENGGYRQLDSRIFIFNATDSSTVDISDGKLDGTNDFDCRFSPNEAQVILTNTSNDGISRQDILLIDTDPDLMGAGTRDVLIENAAMPDFE